MEFLHIYMSLTCICIIFNLQRLEQDYESKIIELEHENEKQRKSSEQLERLVENTSIELETTQVHT